MSKELKVGAFILSSLLVFVGTFMYVANIQRGVRTHYKTYFTYAGGIDPGSPVRFGGMKVGAITAIRPCRADPTKIEVLFEVRQDIPVNTDSLAMLTSVSPLGDKYLEITTGTKQARRVPPEGTIRSMEAVTLDDVAKQVSAIIPTVQATLQDVQQDIDQLTGNAGVVLANMQSMTGPQNQRNLTFLLANARQLLDKESPQIDRVLRNLDQASSQASDSMNQANDALNAIGAAARSANDAFASQNRTVGEIGDQVKTQLAELQRTMTDARRLIGDLNTLVSANQYSIDDTLENFRAASENLRELTTSVKQRPWTLIRGGKPAPDRALPVATARP